MSGACGSEKPGKAGGKREKATMPTTPGFGNVALRVAWRRLWLPCSRGEGSLNPADVSLFVLHGREVVGLVETQPAAAVLVGLLASGLLDKDAAHGLGRRGEEVTAAIPVLGLIDIDQPQVGVMDQGRGLEGLPGTSWAILAAASRRSSS